VLCFARDKVMPEGKLRELLGNHGFSIANLSSRLTDSGRQFEYRMVLRSRNPPSAEMLSQQLRDLPEVLEFRISPPETRLEVLH
jgi:putative Mg2+ transporter-C (MgtC) family protein